MKGYDLDDTLSSVNYTAAGVRGLANVFKSGQVLFVPDSDFIVITARPHGTQELRNATIEWLRKNQPNYRGIRWVDGSEEEIIQKKADLIRSNNLTSFTDNNVSILRRLKEILPASVQLFRMVGKQERKY